MRVKSTVDRSEDIGALKRWLELIFVATVFVFIEAATADDWLHFGYDSEYTSHNAAESLITSQNVGGLQRKWGIGCDDGWFSVMSRTPAIRDNILYSSGAGRNLIAQEARTGEILWEFGEGNFAWAPQPTVSEDGIVFYLEEGTGTLYSLYGVDGASGAQIWRSTIDFDMGFNHEALVTVDETNGWVYFVQAPFIGDGSLYALDKETGVISWYMSAATHDADFDGAWVLLRDGKIFARAEIPIEEYLGSAEKMLRIDPLTQQIELAYDRPEPENFLDIGSFISCGERLVVQFLNYNNQTSEKTVVAYDAAGPADIVWQKEFASEKALGEMPPDFACNAERNLVYVPTNPYLYALDLDTGDEVWRYQGFGPIYSPSVANGVIYFLSDTNMWAIDEETQQQLLNWPLGYGAGDTTQIAIDDGMLYFSGNGGTCDLFALGFDTSEPVPHITANGSDGPLALNATGSLSIAIELNPGSMNNNNADWWAVYYNASSGWYYYDLAGGWTSIGNSLDHLQASYQGPVFSLGSLEIFRTETLPPGTYDFYFGIDLTMNGLLDGALYYDYVTVDVSSAPMASVDVSGTWDGVWNSSVYSENGTFTASIQQQGATLSGSIDVPEIGLFNQALKGTVDGSAITFGDIGDQITFIGTVSGESSAAGTYVYPLLDDSGSWQGAKRSVLEACENVAGSWSATESVIDNDCGTTGAVNKTYVFVQNGCDLSLTDDRGGTYSGTSSGNQISLTGSFPDSGGVTTVTSANISVSADRNSLSGTASWVWGDGDDSCSGSTQVSASRLL